MTVTLYVDWIDRELYRNDEELVNGYIEYCDEDESFRSWLDANYNSDEIFAFTEYEKEEAKTSFNEYLLRSAKNWAYDNGMVYEIEI